MLVQRVYYRHVKMPVFYITKANLAVFSDDLILKEVGGRRVVTD